MTDSLALEYYRTKLGQHDWFFHYSEDYKQWNVGRAEREELMILQPRLDPDHAIWNSIAPEEFRRK